MNLHALERLEFPRVLADVADRTECDGARQAIAAALPIAAAARRVAECARLAAAIRRTREPGAWLWVGDGGIAVHLEDENMPLDPPALIEIGSWLAAAAQTAWAWHDEETAERHPPLRDLVRELPELDALRERLRTAFDPDGRVSDAASPALRRARADLMNGERELNQRLERWARGFGEAAYVTRHAGRFVAMVPAAGFARNRGIVHDVSRSGQSLVVEPLESTDANNRLIELGSAVVEEEQRVLRELASDVRAAREPLARLEDVLTHLDTLRARARWALERDAIAVTPGGDRLVVRAARHPLLVAAGTPVVPLDLELDRAGSLLLVSGPNMGGKTVLLKTVGLAVALAHAAFPVAAAEGSAIPEIDAIEVDLGDEQSLDRGLSTFAAHLAALDAMARAAGPRTLLLCDELGAGTDPEEGGPLGRALIEHFAAHGAWAVITTHLGALKLLAGTVPGVVNGSLEIDEAAMAPTFRFLRGVPGASHALAMAERLGFDKALVARARGWTREEARTLERVLHDLQALRHALDGELADLTRARAAAEEAERAHRAAAEDAKRSLDQLTRGLTRESEALLGRARELWQSVQREARRADKSKADADALRRRLEEVDREREGLRDRGVRAYGDLGLPERDAPGARLAPEDVRPGLKVRVPELNMEAEVVTAPDGEGQVKLRRGNWTITSHVARLEPIGTGSASAGPGAGAAAGARATSGAHARAEQRPRANASWEAPESAPLEVDLRGMESDEALRALDGALDRATVGGLSELRVIHGIGKGVLRAAVARHLKDHPQVVRTRMGQVGEGGRGVTVATLR